MEVINVEQNAIFPSSKAASTLDGQRSELMLPQVSTLDNEYSQNDGLSSSQCLVMYEKSEGGNFSSTKNNSTFEDENSVPHSLQEDKPGYSITAQQQGADTNGVIFKGSRNLNMDLFYISQGDQIKAHKSSRFSDQVSDENKSSSTNNRVHKAPVSRQDSVAFDLTLGSPNEAMHSSIMEIKRQCANGQTEVLGSTYNKNIPTQPKQTLSPHEDITPSIEYGPMIGKNQICYKSSSDLEWLFPEKSTEEMCDHAGLEQVNCQIQPDKNNVKSFPFANNDNSNEAKGPRSTKQNHKLGKNNDTIWNQVILYAKLGFVIFVMVMLVCLHKRVSALESYGASSMTMRCQCDKTSLTKTFPFIDKINDAANGETADFNYKKTQQQILTYFDNESHKPSPGGDTEKMIIHRDGIKNIQANQKYSVFNTGQRQNKRVDSMQTKQPIIEINNKTKRVKTNPSIHSLNISDNADLSLPTNKNKKEVNETHDFPDSSMRAVESFPMMNDSPGAGIPVVTMDVTGHEVSRHKRHAGKKQIDDRAYKAKVSRQKKNHENRSNGPQVESFDIPYWSEFFHFPKHFNSQDPLAKHTDCTTRHKWGHGVEACKDARVIFPTKHSILPFYRPTNTTANKEAPKRLIHINARGQFHVNISGVYLFQQNITILSDSEKHFLALYVNGQATLACQHGGFVCPHTNDEINPTRYKVCVILGVLELIKGDILDVRTMESHMTIRVEISEQKKSHIKFILLNKIK